MTAKATLESEQIMPYAAGYGGDPLIFAVLFFFFFFFSHSLSILVG